MRVKDESLYAAEALLRIHDKNGNFISPAEAIPILEESGLIIPVGKWIIQNAFSMCTECRKYYPEFRVSICSDIKESTYDGIKANYRSFWY